MGMGTWSHACGRLQGIYMNITMPCWKQASEMSSEKGVLRNFTKSTGKHLPRSFFFNKVACLRTATLLKKKL